MRLLTLFEARTKPRSHPTELTPEMKRQIRAWRKECRINNGGGGMCHEVSEIIEQEWGWERISGTYCHSDGKIVCYAHYWNAMPDGTVVDSTADQFGEDDIRVIKPGHPVFKQYRPEWYQDYHPGHPDFGPDDVVNTYTWDGRYDSDAADEDRAKYNLTAGWELTSVKKLQRLRKYLIDRLRLEGNSIYGDGAWTREQIAQVEDRIKELSKE